jgi:rhamnosyl/mannosyltransferase
MLAEAQAAQGDDVAVLVTNTDGYTTREVHNGVKVIKTARALAFSSTPFSLAMPVEAATLRPEVVNLHMPYPPGDIVVRTIPSRPALVVTYHSDVVRQRRLLQIYRPLLEATLRSARRIIVTSRPYLLSSPFLRPHAECCRVVPLAVDASRFSTFDGAEIQHLRAQWPGPILLSVGVLRYYKGLHILLAALRDLDAHLIIVGDGPERARLETLAAELGVAQRAHFVGRVPDEDLPSYYQAADIFVLPSHLRAEAFGIVLLEAMAACLPVVTAEIGTATSEINRHGETGFVVPADNPSALARALQTLLADKSLREYFGQNGRRQVLQNYTVPLLVERTAAVYHEALAARG